MVITTHNVLSSLLNTDNDKAESLKKLMTLLTEQSNKINELLESSWYNVNFMEVAEMLNDGVLIVDKDGMIVNSNRKFLELTGFLEEDLVGHPIQEYIDKGYFDEDIIQEMLAGNVVKQFYSEKLVKNRMHLLSGIPFGTQEDEVRGIAIAIRDTTELMEKQLRLEELEREKERTDEELSSLKRMLTQTDIIGETAAMKHLKEVVLNVAPTDASVLITGETGCGKEVVAKAIYKNSKRAEGPYVKINCAAIPEQLMESELFGYEKGAFTGANTGGKKGLFEMADGGTVLLDEVGEMPLSLQPKLLRVLQEHEIRRVGGVQDISINVRVIASTNQDLRALIKERKFREDLYYRLNVVPIHVPPLRERKPDILLLAKKFVENFSKKYGKDTFLPVAAMMELESYDWPGNVRELENVIERLVVLNKGHVINASLVAGMVGTYEAVYTDQEELKLDDAVNYLEYSMITKALEEYGSTYKAAEALGITQSRIVRKMKALNITQGKSKTN